jgi:sulfur carrier protein
VTVLVNGAPREVGPDTDIAGLVASLPAPAEGTAVALNGEVLPRARWAGTTLADGDRVEVLTAVQGG